VDERDIRVWLLNKLKRKGCWGEGHLSADNLVKGQDRRFKKMILKTADKLVKEGLLVRFPHGSQNHYYLNRESREEIERIIDGS